MILTIDMLQEIERCPPLARQTGDEWIVTQPFSPERLGDDRVSPSPTKSPLLKPCDFNLRIQEQQEPATSSVSRSPRLVTRVTPTMTAGAKLLPPSAFAPVSGINEAVGGGLQKSPEGQRTHLSEHADDTLADIQR